MPQKIFLFLRKIPSTYPVGCNFVFDIFSFIDIVFNNISLSLFSSCSIPSSSSSPKFKLISFFHFDSSKNEKQTISPCIALFKFLYPSITISLSNKLDLIVALSNIPF